MSQSTTLQELADAALSDETEAPESGDQFVTAESLRKLLRKRRRDEAAPADEVSETTDTVGEHTYYYDVDHVVLYLDTYGHLPENYITKDEARALGWEGGSVEVYQEGAAIGGDRFGNREGLLPEQTGRSYTECDINTDGTDFPRGRAADLLERRAVFLHVRPLRELYRAHRRRRDGRMEPLSFTIDCRELVSCAAAHDCFARILPARRLRAESRRALRRADESAAVRITLCGHELPLSPARRIRGKSCCRSSATQHGITKISSSRRIRNFLSISHCLSILQESGQFFLVEIVNLQSTALSDKIRNMNEL